MTAQQIIIIKTIPMAQHTPAPWCLEIDMDAFSCYDRIYIVKDGREVCAIPVEIPDDYCEEERANANLLLAAPDLLAACEAMVMVWKSCGPEEWDAAVDQIIEVIAKAKGDAPCGG